MERISIDSFPFLSVTTHGRLCTAPMQNAVVCGGMLAVGRCGARALPVGVATGAAFFLILLTIGVLAFQSAPREGRGVLLLCACLCGGAGAGLAGRLIRPKKKRRK